MSADPAFVTAFDRSVVVPTAALPLPGFPAPAFEAVTGLLTTVASQRHGQAAMIHALSRPQRSTGSVSAF